MNVIEATFTITREEYIRAMRRHYRSKLSVVRDVVGSCVVIGLGLYLLNTSNAMIAWFAIVSGVLLLALVGYAILLWPNLLYRWQPKLKSEYRLRFSESGIEFRTDSIDANLKWTMYQAWLQDKEFFILYHSVRDLSVIPKRCMTTDSEVGFRSLLERMLGPARNSN